MITLKDVAREVGVSVHSVSAVLNGNAKRYRISEGTSERVIKTAQKMGYDPENHRSARQMAARRHGTKIPNDVVALCTMPNRSPLHRQPFLGEILDGIESAADRYNLDVLQCRLRPERLPRLIEKGEVDGVIALSGRPWQLDELRRLNVPLVHLGSAIPSCHSVSAQSYQGMLEATSHLIDLGHREIAFIGHNVTISSDESTVLDTAKQRLAGFETAMQKAGLPIEFVDSTLTESYPEVGAETFATLWKKSQGRISAVVCYNDSLAMGVIQSAREIGLDVPADLSVVGFDAVSRQYAFEPTITSVGYDLVDMGMQAVEILMKVRESNGEEMVEEYLRIELPVRLEAGATTAPVRKNAF